MQLPASTVFVAAGTQPNTVLAREDVLVIPKTGRRERLKENLGALDHALSAEQLTELDALFPPPKAASALQML